MLDRFKVPKEDQVKVSESALRKTVEDIFEKTGLSKEDAKNGTDVLVTADLRGVETHGVSNMLRVYVQLFEDGDLNKTPNIKVVKESPGTATIDAEGTWNHGWYPSHGNGHFKSTKRGCRSGYYV